MATKKRQSASAPVHLRRMYLDCRYGQLHLATAYPASGGFDEAAPIVFLHAEDGTGADFNRCAALLGTDRSDLCAGPPGQRRVGRPEGPHGDRGARARGRGPDRPAAPASASTSSVPGAARSSPMNSRRPGPERAPALIVAGTSSRDADSAADAAGVDRTRRASRRSCRRPRQRDPQLPRPHLGRARLPCRRASARVASSTAASSGSVARLSRSQPMVVTAMPASSEATACAPNTRKSFSVCAWIRSPRRRFSSAASSPR